MLSHTCLTGAVSEQMVSGYLASRGCEVFAATSSHSRADMIYLRGPEIKRVQVKTSSVFTTGPHRYEQCRLVRKGINEPYTADEVDELWIVGTHLWCFPIDVIGNLTSITLLSDNPSPRKTVRAYDPNEFVMVHGHLDRPFKDRLFANDPTPSVFLSNFEHSPETLRAMKYKVSPSHV